MIGKRTRIVPFGIAALFTTGCANLTSAPILTADPCADLKTIVADYPNRFEDLRGSRSDFSTVTVYRAKKDIVKGHCEIWEWAGGDTAYVCSLNAPNDQVANHRYQETVNFLGGCFGEEWSAEVADRVRDGESAGTVTRYRHPDHPGMVISIHNVSLTRAGSAARSNYLFIGSAGRSSQL